MTCWRQRTEDAARIWQKKNGERALPIFLFSGLPYLELPMSAFADSSPTAMAYFLPLKRISDSDLLPSPLFLSRVESEPLDWSRFTIRAGVEATTVLPLRMFSCTLDPLPSHFTE